MKKLQWKRNLIILTALSALVLGAPVAQAVYISGFENLNASAAGVVLTGQDGFYLPPAGGVDFWAFTYAGNALGYPQNPTGQEQFIAGLGPGGGVYARAQHDHAFDETDVWVLGYDFCAAYLGSPPSGNNLGSFSVRNEGAAVSHYIHLMTWVDVNDPTLFNAFYMPYDAGGVQFPQPGESPGPEWEGLELMHWYRAWSVIDLDANLFLEVGIRDLETNVEAVVYPEEWYLEGGSGGGTAIPDCFRFFAGGSVENNSLAFDNISIDLLPTATQETTWGAVKALY